MYHLNYQSRDSLYLVISRIVQSSSWRLRLLFYFLNNILSARYFFGSIFFYPRFSWWSFFSCIFCSRVTLWLPICSLWRLSCVLGWRRSSCILWWRRFCVWSRFRGMWILFLIIPLSWTSFLGWFFLWCFFRFRWSS